MSELPMIWKGECKRLVHRELVPVREGHGDRSGREKGGLTSMTVELDEVC